MHQMHQITFDASEVGKCITKIILFYSVSNLRLDSNFYAIFAPISKK